MSLALKNRIRIDSYNATFWTCTEVLEESQSTKSNGAERTSVEAKTNGGFSGSNAGPLRVIRLPEGRTALGNEPLPFVSAPLSALKHYNRRTRLPAEFRTSTQ
ncbi:hypothetical protein MHYP_G00264040 [Metynnis hypsauchen]